MAKRGDARLKAAKVAAQCGVKVVYGNDRGEYFVSYNLALMSAGRDEKKVVTFDFSKPGEGVTDGEN